MYTILGSWEFETIIFHDSRYVKVTTLRIGRPYTYEIWICLHLTMHQASAKVLVLFVSGHDELLLGECTENKLAACGYVRNDTSTRACPQPATGANLR